MRSGEFFAVSFTNAHPPTSSRLSPAQRQKILTTLLSAATWQIRHVGVRRQSLRNLPASLNLTDLDETVTGLSNGPGDGLSTLGLTLGTDDVGLTLLLGALDDETSPLRVLLGNLLLLDGLGELAAKGHVGDGDVLEGNVELGGAEGEIGSNALGDGLTLGDELGSIELGDDGLEDFVADRGEYSLIVIGTKVLNVIQMISNAFLGTRSCK